jgi:hypothetical protein
MDDRAHAPLLIHTRRGAVIALCIGILFTLRNFRCLFELYVPGHTSWLTRYQFPQTLFDLIFNLCYAVLFTGGLIFILRRSRGGERAYLAIFVGSAILSQVRIIPFAKSAHLDYWLVAILELALIPSAVWMYKTLPARRLAPGGKVTN